MIKFLRKYLITFIRILISIFIPNRNSVNDIDDLIILGRGSSLVDYYKNFNQLSNVKNIAIINFTKKDIGNNIKSLENRNVIPVINIEEPVISLFQIIKLKIKNCYITRMENQKLTSKLNRNYKGVLYGKLNYFRGDIVNTFYEKQVGSGFLAVVFFSKILKVKNIYLFGFDFYQIGMHNVSLIENFGSEKSIILHKRNGKKNLIEFEKFITNTPDTNFYFPKDTNISVNSSNFKLLDF